MIAASKDRIKIELVVNGRIHHWTGPAMERLSRALREDMGLRGTKVGCDAGDCGACTVRLDGQQVCACLVAMGQVDGAKIETVEGLAKPDSLSPLQTSFLVHGAAQCGICTPGMLMAADDLLARNPRPTEHEVEEALGGVLCRCTGYRKIIEAVLDVDRFKEPEVGIATPEAGRAVGSRVARADGLAKVNGQDHFGDDSAPPDALWLRAIRSPHASARFRLGDLDSVVRNTPGLHAILRSGDVPGENSFGIYPNLKDQPVLAAERVRYRGEAIVALVGEYEAISTLSADDLPIEWQIENSIHGVDEALHESAEAIHANCPNNVVVEGHVERGNVQEAFATAPNICSGSVETAHVEHAYIEPEAGFARRCPQNPNRMEVTACTQAPYMDREEVARVLGIPPADVRIVPTACGGGFGGKLDVSIQPLLAVAAWLLEKPVRGVYGRGESMACSTKRHPVTSHARAAADSDGRLIAFQAEADFNTGAYASWGPTVADRVPVHATGPYLVPNARAHSRAIYSNDTPAGAFRGFGVPQMAVLQESLYDDLADQLGMDPLEFRHLNALRPGQTTATGQVLDESVGMAACLEALRPHWRKLRTEAEHQNHSGTSTHRRGVGVGCMWYGCGNTSLSNPSTIRITLTQDGELTLFSGAVDIGQGSTTVILQIAADALGLEMSNFEMVLGDTDLTEDAGKTSASRQTYVSGRAAMLAARSLRQQILDLGGHGPGATLSLEGSKLRVAESQQETVIDLGKLNALDNRGSVVVAQETFDPPTSPLDEMGQGSPYATYGFAAQLCDLEVDMELGTVALRRFVAAHDMGRAINPSLVEGQIHGGIAQGIGFALMEEFIPGRTENLHDYLIPSFGDVPEIDILMIEDADPLGPFGAKGIGEPALIATAPAIFSAIRHATGVVVDQVPLLPHRLLEKIQQGRRNENG